MRFVEIQHLIYVIDIYLYSLPKGCSSFNGENIFNVFHGINLLHFIVID